MGSDPQGSTPLPTCHPQCSCGTLHPLPLLTGKPLSSLPHTSPCALACFLPFLPPWSTWPRPLTAVLCMGPVLSFLTDPWYLQKNKDFSKRWIGLPLQCYSNSPLFDKKLPRDVCCLIHSIAINVKCESLVKYWTLDTTSVWPALLSCWTQETLFRFVPTHFTLSALLSLKEDGVWSSFHTSRTKLSFSQLCTPKSQDSVVCWFPHHSDHFYSALFIYSWPLLPHTQCHLWPASLLIV